MKNWLAALHSPCIGLSSFTTRFVESAGLSAVNIIMTPHSSCNAGGSGAVRYPSLSVSAPLAVSGSWSVPTSSKLRSAARVALATGDAICAAAGCSTLSRHASMYLATPASPK